MGEDALQNNTTGEANTATGLAALARNATCSSNTATGSEALVENASGGANTATGAITLLLNTTGLQNTATGAGALEFNTSGNNNTANGSFALNGNTTGNANTANGASALGTNTTGSNNTSNGYNALFTNKTGSENTANGSGSLFSNRCGNFNTATGRDALFNNKTRAFNIALGNNAGFSTTGSHNIEIGNEGVADESNTIRIGTVGTQTATFIAGISGVTVPAGVGVIVGTDGKLGTVVFSERFKDAVKPMDKASEAILALQPVTFRCKQDLDPAGVQQFDLVNEEVEKINPDLVTRDDQGKPYTVRYEAVNAMLLNEFLKDHKAVQEQGATIARLQKQIEALTAGLQKVSDQLELARPAPQTVSMN